MTCQELNLRLDDFVRKALEQSDRDSVAEHLSSCAACRRLFEERAELETNLQFVRDGVAKPSEALDARVLANFRQLMSVRTSASIWTFSRPAILAWTGFAAAALLLGTALIAMRPKKTIATPTPSQTPQTVAASPVPPEPIKSPVVQAKQAVPPRHIPKVRPQSAVERTSASAEVVRLLPEDFRRLMYCDALSCAQDMDMIRVQLPSTFVVRPGRGLSQPGGLVNADVLVGPDGIARGIRFEQ